MKPDTVCQGNIKHCCSQDQLSCPTHPLLNTLHCSTLHRSTLHRSTLHCSTLNCSTLHFSTLHCSTLHRSTLHCSTLHRSTLHCSTLHCSTLHCSGVYEKSPLGNFSLSGHFSMHAQRRIFLGNISTMHQ